MGEDRFSRRFGHHEEREITIRDAAPPDARAAMLMIAKGDLGLGPHRIRMVLCTVLRRLPDPGNWSAYPNVWDECQDLMRDAPWYRVYDFAEELYRSLAGSDERDERPLAGRWEELLNEHFVEAGVGWKMVEGTLQSRGAEAFEAAVGSAREALANAGLETARQEIHEALRDLSRRPDPDVTGAIHHAMAALECTAREAVGDQRATLGEILRRHPDLLPRPLDDATSKLWGYASETARHVREGRLPSRMEAELLVTIAAATCTYLTSKIRG